MHLLLLKYPKLEEAYISTDSRPSILINESMKLITKVLVRRLKNVMTWSLILSQHSYGIDKFQIVLC